MLKPAIEKELLARANRLIPQTHLIVDYYRVRRRVAYPLPVRAFCVLEMPLRTFPSKGYPWATWLTWELEERIHALGWAGELLDDSASRQAVAADVAALANWPAYRQYEQPDLSLGHAARTLWAAHKNWGWLGGTLREQIESAFARLIDDVRPFSDKKHGAYTRKQDILSLPEPHAAVHNIPLIGTIGAALAAHTIKHPALEVFNQRIDTVFSALLDLRDSGLTEGVAYDGYVLDFIADWFAILPDEERKKYLSHPQFARMLDESWMLSAPGDMLNVAEIGDVEPREMTFHVSAQAKLLAYDPSTRRQWYLQHCRVESLRADALGVLFDAQMPHHAISDAPTGTLDAHYARVLRSGFAPDDLAVCVAACDSAMGHMQCDNGTILIGTAGKWLLTDPGYQQYLQTSEAAYTLGPGAHNAPVINGIAQTLKKPSARALDNLPAGRHGVEIELAACYPADLKLSSVKRTVWLCHDDLVVVADRVAGETISEIAYHWHGHAQAGWWTQDAAACIATNDAALWIQSPQCPIAEAQIDRQRGSRGQLTLRATTPAVPVVWWIFSTDKALPKVESSGAELRVNGMTFTVS